MLIPTTVEHYIEKDPEGRDCYCMQEHWVDKTGTKRSAPGGYTDTTACWREYKATWELKDRLFYLTDIQGRFRPGFDVPVFADWFTGVLRIKSGRELCYVHMGFGTVREFETHIAIEAGYEMGRRTIDKRGKEYDWTKLGWQSLPGRENFFPGDTEI